MTDQIAALAGLCDSECACLLKIVPCIQLFPALLWHNTTDQIAPMVGRCNGVCELLLNTVYGMQLAVPSPAMTGTGMQGEIMRPVPCRR